MDLDPSRFEQDEHEKYYFGCSSTEVYDCFKYSILKCITTFMEECRNTLLEECSHIDKDLIKSEIEELKDVYFKACLEELSKFKITLQHIFHIPPNVDIYQKSKVRVYTPEQIDLLRKEVEELEKEFFREKMFLEILKQEKKTIDKLQPLFLNTKETLANLKNEKEREKNQKLRKWLKRHENCVKNSPCDTENTFDI